MTTTRRCKTEQSFVPSPPLPNHTRATLPPESSGCTARRCFWGWRTSAPCPGSGGGGASKAPPAPRLAAAAAAAPHVPAPFLPPHPRHPPPRSLPEAGPSAWGGLSGREATSPRSCHWGWGLDEGFGIDDRLVKVRQKGMGRRVCVVEMEAANPPHTPPRTTHRAHGSWPSQRTCVSYKPRGGGGGGGPG